jgi:very-short-patch-repair endonuclease
MKLATEVDGPIHDQRGGYDTDRVAVLLRNGIKVLRFPDGAVLSSPRSVARQIEIAISKMEQ